MWAPGARQNCKRDFRVVEKQSLRLKSEETAAQFVISVVIQIFLKAFILNPPRTHFLYGDYPESDRCLRTSSLIVVQSVHLTLPHEFQGRSNRECQDLRLGRLGVPRPARIAARLTLCPRDLPGLRIRLTTVPCILPERHELTWCHRGICRRDRLIIVP
ncbi:F-box family protein with DUF295 [Prunus dulcis]|uniref:F-box family protein with DUF295 n=1 Tax=Prunus dulcis TaxID=3755 RepID=A0A5H2YB87_PRUDU|nr:F-box family protein with DUF295 [Prunus dulcis]